MRALLVVLLCVTTHAVAATVLTARVDKQTLVLGEALQLEITGHTAGSAAPLENLSLEQLRVDFELQDISRNTQTVMRAGKTEITQTLTATLYPLRSGVLKIPVLNILHARSPALDIRVHESGGAVPRVVLRTGVEPDQSHVRETVLLYLDIYDNGSLVWAAVDTPTAPGMHLRELAQTRRDASIAGEKFKVVRYMWAATPLRDGTHTLQFPLLRANKFGVRLRYAAPPLKFNVQAVPAYVPVMVPVSPALQLHVVELPSDIVVNRPVNWRFSVTGRGLSENGLAQLISTTLGAAPGVRFYPLHIETETAARSSTLEQTFRVTLPFQAQHSGELELPELSIPYFDPLQERIVNVALPKQHITALSIYRQSVLWMGGISLVMLMFAWPVYRGLLALRRLQCRWQGLQRIERAQDIHALKAALLNYDASGTGKNTLPRTLRSWLRQLSMTYRLEAEFNLTLQHVERAIYAAGPVAGDFTAMKLTMLRNIKQLHR